MSLATMYAQRKQQPVYNQGAMGGMPSSPYAPAQPAPQPAGNWNDEKSIAAGQGGVAQTAAGYGQSATADYAQRITSFDPTAAINKYATGTWNSMIGGPGGFNDQLTRLRGNEVAGGRLDTGFYDEDQGQLYRSTVNDFSNDLSRTAVQGANMEMANNQAIGAFGQQQQGLGLDLGVARREELINNKREADERKRKKKRGIAGAIGGVIGGVGGFLVGGPAGAAAGYGVGSKVGQGIAG
jgi:hypothetical protein